MASAGGRSKQSSDLDRPLLRAVYLPLRIERSRPSSFLLQGRQRRAQMSFRARLSRQGGCDSSAASLRSARHSPSVSRRSAPFFGQRHRRELGGLALQERQHPAGWVLRSAPAGLPDHAVAPTTRQLRSIGSPARAMRPGRALPAVEFAPRQPEPGVEVASPLEQSGVAAFITRSEAISRRRRGSPSSVARPHFWRASRAGAGRAPRSAPQARMLFREPAKLRANVGMSAPARRSRRGSIAAYLCGDEAKLGPMTADRIHELRALRTNRSRWPASIKLLVDRSFSPARSAYAADLPPRTAPPHRPHRSRRAPRKAWQAVARSTAPRAQAASTRAPNDAPPHTLPSPPPSPAASLRRAAPGARLLARSATCSFTSTP